MMRYREPRFPCNRRASLRVGISAENREVEVINVSAHGARMQGAPPLAEGMVVLLSVPPLQSVRGVVKWAGGGQLGMSFDAPLTARTLAILRQSVGHKVRPWRPPRGNPG